MGCIPLTVEAPLHDPVGAQQSRRALTPHPHPHRAVLQPRSILTLPWGCVPYLSKSSPPVTNSSTRAISEGVSKISFSLI